MNSPLTISPRDTCSAHIVTGELSRFEELRGRRRWRMSPDLHDPLAAYSGQAQLRRDAKQSITSPFRNMDIIVGPLLSNFLLGSASTNDPLLFQDRAMLGNVLLSFLATYPLLAPLCGQLLHVDVIDVLGHKGLSNHGPSFCACSALEIFWRLWDTSLRDRQVNDVRAGRVVSGFSSSHGSVREGGAYVWPANLGTFMAPVK